MKIDDSLKKTAGLTVNTSKSGSASKSVDKAETGDTSAVKVQLSSQAKTLATQVSSASVFDSNKVDEIKAAIAGGRFQVDAGKVADGLMDTVRDLIQNRKA